MSAGHHGPASSSSPPAGPGCTKSGASRACSRSSRSARRSTRRGCARAPAGRHSPTKPSSSRASTSAGRASRRLSVPHAPSALGSPRSTARQASSSGCASRAASVSTRSAVDRLSSARSTPWAASPPARSAPSWAATAARGLAGHVQPPGAVLAAGERRLGTALQRGEELGWPEMLVDVGAREDGHRREQSTECLPDLCSIANRALPGRRARHGRRGRHAVAS